MNQLLQEAFDRAADLPDEEQDRFADSCWPSSMLTKNGTSYLTGRNRMSC